MERIEQPGALQEQHDFDADESAQHEDLATGEVDKLQHAVDHRVAQGDQRVHEAQDDAIQEDLREDFQRDFQCDADPSAVAMLTNRRLPRHCFSSFVAKSTTAFAPAPWI
jgi:hypothetical protein